MTLQERHPEIREHEVKDGLVRPVYPLDWQPLENDVMVAGKWHSFEAAHRDKVYPTDLSPGRYKAEELKEVWQHYRFGNEWVIEVNQETYPGDYGKYRRACLQQGYDTRIFITRADQPEAKEVSIDTVIAKLKALPTTPINPNVGEKETVTGLAKEYSKKAGYNGYWGFIHGHGYRQSEVNSLQT